MIPLTDEISRAVKFTETESIRVVQGLREKNKELVLSGYRVSVLQDERSLEIIGGDGLHNQ